MCFFMYFLLCYFSSFIHFLIYNQSKYSEIVSNIQIHCNFFPLCTYLKADDTYIQLKKDLEYLDLKVRFYRSLLPLFLFNPVVFCVSSLYLQVFRSSSVQR